MIIRRSIIKLGTYFGVSYSVRSTSSIVRMAAWLLGWAVVIVVVARVGPGQN